MHPSIHPSIDRPIHRCVGFRRRSLGVVERPGAAKVGGTREWSGQVMIDMIDGALVSGCSAASDDRHFMRTLDVPFRLKGVCMCVYVCARARVGGSQHSATAVCSWHTIFRTRVASLLSIGRTREPAKEKNGTPGIWFEDSGSGSGGGGSGGGGSGGTV